nr:MAG TPA: hypothetical protein [Caudoviricetes sp.]
MGRHDPPTNESINQSVQFIPPSYLFAWASYTSPSYYYVAR